MGRRAGLAMVAVVGAAVLALTGVAAVTPAGADEVPPDAVGVPAELPDPVAGSTRLGCEHAGERVTLTTSTHLDPSCPWTAGFDITASDVVLDCRGARVASTGGGRGIEIATPIDVDLTGVVIRHCRVEGFLNSIRATRDGFRTLEPGEEYDHRLGDVLIEHNDLGGSRGVGVFVDGYVSEVTIRANRIIGAGSTGIYLETGSRRNRVEGNVIHDNGFVENGPDGQIDQFAGLRFRWWGAGREGLAIDGSWENEIVGNDFAGNSHGGVFLYTNCGEFPDSGRWFDRRWPADRNRIEGNTFTGGLNGIWVGQRMAENTLPMECTKPAYVEEPFRRVTLDHAADNTIADNEFVDVTYAIRIEDDGTTVSGNHIVGSSPDHHGIIVGTEDRTTVLGRPVARTVVVDNDAEIAGNPSPYRWIHGYDGLRFEGNTANGAPAGICEGAQPPRLTLIWVIAAVLEPLGSPPTPPPADLSHPVLGELAPCPPSVTPRVVPGGANVDEGAGTATITITLDRPADRTVRVPWSTPVVDSPGWALAGTDLEYAEGAIEFDPGRTEATVAIAIIDDDVADPGEYGVVWFRDPQGARMGGFYGLGLIAITDDD